MGCIYGSYIWDVSWRTLCGDDKYSAGRTSSAPQHSGISVLDDAAPPFSFLVGLRSKGLLNGPEKVESVDFE